MVVTPWVAPAIQVHTKGPHRKPFSPANGRLHSTRPNNRSQLRAFIHMQLFTISPYPEQIHTRKHAGAHLNINARLQAHTAEHAYRVWMIREKMLLQEDCNQRATSTTPQSFLLGLCCTDSFSHSFFSLCSSIQHFCGFPWDHSD